MSWEHIIALILGNAGIIIPLFYWNRSEANADRRHQQAETTQLRRDLVDVMRSIDQEIKDFHGRLCTIEERRK